MSSARSAVTLLLLLLLLLLVLLLLLLLGLLAYINNGLLSRRLLAGALSIQNRYRR